MARSFIILSILALLSSCAPSALYFHVRPQRPGTGGEIPRDGRGEPIWSAINAPPAYPADRPQPR